MNRVLINLGQRELFLRVPLGRGKEKYLPHSMIQVICRQAWMQHDSDNKIIAIALRLKMKVKM
jgi:hypothetical protein